MNRKSFFFPFKKLCLLAAFFYSCPCDSSFKNVYKQSETILIFILTKFRESLWVSQISCLVLT